MQKISVMKQKMMNITMMDITITKGNSKALCTILLAVILTSCSSSDVKSDWTSEEIEAISSQVKQDEIILYGSDDCPYCRNAKAWLEQNNFTYKDCEMNRSTQCYDEYTELNGNGIPLIVVSRNGTDHQLNDGFDSNELLTVLQDK